MDLSIAMLVYQRVHTHNDPSMIPAQMLGWNVYISSDIFRTDLSQFSSQMPGTQHLERKWICIHPACLQSLIWSTTPSIRISGKAHNPHQRSGNYILNRMISMVKSGNATMMGGDNGKITHKHGLGWCSTHRIPPHAVSQSSLRQWMF